MVFAQTPVSWHLNNMIPNRKQWKKWTLPSKLTAIGAYIGVIGLIITIIWLLIDNIKLKNESILITCESFIEDAPIEWNEGYGNDLPYQLTLTFPITIINNGIKPFTIVDYKLYPYNCAYVCACAFNYTFRGRDGDKGLYNLSNDTDPIIFPFSIKSGEGKTVFLKTAVVVYDCSRLFDSEEKITKENPSLFDLKVASTIWNRNNKNDGNYGESYDFFGNETSYAIGVRGLMGISLRYYIRN